MSMPEITVAIPAYNHAAYLPQTFESVLGQTFKQFEVIVADDGSTDNSLEIAEFYAARDPRIRVVRHPGGVNRGIAPTSNLAASGARGRYVTWLDSDDLWYPDTLERRFEFMEQRRDIGLMCSYFDIIDGEGRIQKRRSGPDISVDCGHRPALVHRLIMGCDIGAPTVMLRRSCLETLGMFDDLVYCDWEMWTRLAARYPVGFFEDALVMYRRHGKNYSSHLMIADDLTNRLAVMQALLLKTPRVGGWLKHVRIQAALHLQTCCFQFCLNRRLEAAESLVRALRVDRTLFEDGGAYFSRWLSVNPPVKAPRKDFHDWMLKCLGQAFGRSPISADTALAALSSE